MQQKLVQNFLPPEAGTFGNKTEKEPQKRRPKLKILLEFNHSAPKSMKSLLIIFSMSPKVTSA